MSESNIALILAYENGYRISKDGLTLITSKKEKQQTHFNALGYPIFSFYNGIQSRTLFWHRLQAYQKYQEQLFNKNIVVRHLNDIKTDCSESNIVIGTQSENMRDIPLEIRLRSTLIAQNQAIKKTRLYNALEIRAFHNIEKSYKITMAQFNISSKGTLYHILNGKYRGLESL